MKFYTLVCFWMIAFKLSAQSYQTPEEFSFSILTAQQLSIPQTTLHSGIQPYIPFFSPQYLHRGDSTKVFKYIKDDPAIDAIFNKHFFSIKDKEDALALNISPILILDGGSDLANASSERYFTNTRGVFATGTIGEKFYFETIFAENQATFPNFLSSYVTTSSVVPGQGRWKVFKVTGYDYAWAGGIISMQPSKKLNIQLGHGKQKIGHGYRSLLWSDNAFNYPYVRFTQQYWKGRIQYSHVYAQLSNLTAASLHRTKLTERLFQRKAAAYQYISINLTKQINLSLFQGMVARPANDYNQQDIPLGFFNPLPFAGRLQFGLNDNRVNVLTGVDFLIKLSKNIQLFGQYMADRYRVADTANLANGFQVGMKYFHAFNWKPLTLQVEYNQAGYGSYNNTLNTTGLNDFTHFQQNLALTGVPGRELVCISNFSAKRFVIHLQYHYKVIAGLMKDAGDLNIVQARIGYVINPAYNFQICAGYLYRKQNLFNFSPSVSEAGWLYLSLRTSLFNTYYDF